MGTWTTCERRTILDHGKYLAVEEHVVELPDGSRIEDWPWVVAPEYVDVVAVTTSGLIVCLRQGKYAIEGTSLAPVAGYIEPGEAPVETAQRELLEETGYTAEKWENLGSYPVDGNRGAGVAHLFLARGARKVTVPEPDDLEEQEVLTLSLEGLRAAVLGQEFKVLPWAAMAALALVHMSA